MDGFGPSELDHELDMHDNDDIQLDETVGDRAGAPNERRRDVAPPRPATSTSATLRLKVTRSATATCRTSAQLIFFAAVVVVRVSSSLFLSSSTRTASQFMPAQYLM